MKKRAILLIGKYAKEECDLSVYEQNFIVNKIDELKDLKKIKKNDLEQIEAIAFKGHTTIDLEIMKKLPSLRLISNFGVGNNTININDAKKQNILVSFTPDILSNDVADMALALYLGVSRKLKNGYDWIKSGNWALHGEMPHNKKISGSKCGILGLGRIGFEIAKRLEAFKTEIHYFSRKPKKVSRKWIYHNDPLKLCLNVENLFVALKGGVSTNGFVSGDFLKALGKDGIVINISRGSVIDENSLLYALENDKIYGAGLDVFLNEPKINNRFFELNNVFMQPHQASATIKTRKEMGELQFQNILNYFETGSPLTLVPELN